MSNLYLNPILCWGGELAHYTAQLSPCCSGEAGLSKEREITIIVCQPDSKLLCSVNAGEHLNVSSFIIIVRRGAGRGRHWRNSFCLQQITTQSGEESSLEIQLQVRLSSYLNCNYDKRKRKADVEHQYTSHHCFYRPYLIFARTKVKKLLLWCHGKRGKVRSV